MFLYKAKYFFLLQHLVEKFPQYLQEWRSVFESDTPQKETIPCEDPMELSRMQLLCVLRCLRPDKVVAAVQDYVAGKKFSCPMKFILRG